MKYLIACLFLLTLTTAKPQDLGKPIDIERLRTLVSQPLPAIKLLPPVAVTPTSVTHAQVSALQREVLELRKALAQVTAERDAALQNAQQNYLAATQAQARVQAGNLQALQALTAPSNRAAEQAQAKEESFRRAREANAELQRSNLEYELQRLNRQLQR
jgi:hypothetical protein